MNSTNNQQVYIRTDNQLTGPFKTEELARYFGDRHLPGYHVIPPRPRLPKKQNKRRY